MTKSPILAKNNKKQNSMGVKDGLVAKKKNQKFKSTPTGKVPLVLDKKSKQNGNKANGTAKSAPKVTGNKQTPKKDQPKVKPEDLESDDEDFGSENDNESMDSDEQNTTDEVAEKKGVQMFKGLKTEGEEDDDDDDDDDSEEGADLDIDDDDDDDDDSEDDDDDDDDLEDEESDDASVNTGLKALLGDSIGDDDDDDDDFDEDDESDEDEDMSDDEEAPIIGSEDDDEDEDEDDDDDDDDDVQDESIGLKALLGDSLVDEEDDDDFDAEDDEEDDDDDISDDSDEDETNDQVPKKEIKEKSKKSDSEESPKKVSLTPEEQAKVEARTIYVGNVPKDATLKSIRQLFRPCGEIETLRVRGVVPEDGKMSAKVATITKKLHPKVQSVYVYVVFKNESSVKEALKLNGHKLGDHTLRVDVSAKSKEHDQKKAVFLGNLPFKLTEDEVREHFLSCGKIESVRIIKDRKSGLSKGIGYINFEEEESVTLALELNDTALKNRQVRVKICSPESKGKKRKYDNKNQKKGQNQNQKKFKNFKGEAVAVEGGEKQGNKKQKRSQGEIKREKSSGSEGQSPSPVKKEKKTAFQGQKANLKKRSKANKMDKKKKTMAEKLTAVKKSKATD